MSSFRSRWLVFSIDCPGREVQLESQGGFQINGAWRSLVAHSAGGRVVGGSNPLAPTISC